MFSRCLAIAAVLALATAVAAEPPRPGASDSAKPANRPVPVMLASADQTPPAAVQAQASVPAKRPRAARVTTCRCGGQSADQQDSSENQ